MIARFQGSDGTRRLVDALAEQRLVNGDRELASLIAEKAGLRHVQKDEVFIRQNEADNDIYFILTGRVSIQINGREVAKRTARTHVGEMAAIDPSARRSADVVALEETVLAALPEPELTRIAAMKPDVWRLIANELADRLRQRSIFLRPPNPTPVLFIGSSREALPIAEALKSEFPPQIATARIWKDGVFGASTFPIEALETQLQYADFAALVAASDDRVISRGKETQAPRDNIVFELGLFMGALGRHRTFLCTPEGVDVKIPSDLLGLTPITYDGNSLAAPVRMAAEEIKRAIAKNGPR